MAGPVTDAHKVTYLGNVRLAIQEKKAQFDEAFQYTSQVKGKQVQVTDIIGKSEARVDAPEGGDTPDIDNNHEPVWMRPRRLDWGKIIKQEDAIKALTDFRSEYVQAGAGGIVRAKNNILASAIFGPRLIGNEVPSSTAWAGREVAIGIGSSDDQTNIGMNVRKILRAMRLMEDDDIVLEEEDLYLVLDPVEMEQLYRDLTFISKDYREKAQLEDMSRRVMSIFGIPVIMSKRLADKQANQSTAALFCKSGMWWGEAMPLTTTVEKNPGKQYRWHPYLEQWLAAARTEDFKAVKIINLY